MDGPTYGDDEALIDFESLTVLAGHLPPRVLGVVYKWAAEHRDELRLNWNLARLGQPLRRVAPWK